LSETFTDADDMILALEQDAGEPDTGMDLRELQAIVSAEIDDAASFIDSDIGPDRARALEFWRGEAEGDLAGEEGRSHAVSRDVADAISSMLPSLMRIFFGSEQPVEFTPAGQEDEAIAEQATDYVNYILTRDNPGFLTIRAAIKDALRSKVGFVKAWWDDSIEATTESYSGLDETALVQVLDTPDVEVVEHEEREVEGPPIMGPQGPVPGPPVSVVDLTVKRMTKRDRVRIEAVPPEELLIDRRAKSIEDATIVAHRTTKTVSDLVALGYDRDEIEGAADDSDPLQNSEERLARQGYGAEPRGGSNDRSTRLVQYVEAYIRVDMDDDGIAELRRVCCVGPGNRIILQEPVSHRPFAAFPCDPEPHAFFGQSIADKTMDIQLVKSQLLRNALDSHAGAINPRTVIIEGRVDIDDVMNTENGAIIRAKERGAVEQLVTPDVSISAFSHLSYWDEVKQSRTGISKAAAGLDANALQSATKMAVAGTLSAAQQHIEEIARVLAETGFKDLYRLILRLLVENQRAERMIQLRNQWIPMDPRNWRTDMDLIANPALGGGTQEEKAQLLGVIAQKQEQIIMQGGPDNPLCGVAEYRNTLAKLLETFGFKNPDAFFKDVANQPEQPPKEPPPDPKLVEAQGKMQIRQMELQSEAQLAQAKVQAEMTLKREQLQAEMQLKREQLQAELQLKRELAMLGAQTQVATSQVSMGGEPG
jgi:hypothetical protein